MGLGGQFTARQERVPARLVRAYTGVTAFPATAWMHARSRSWVLDYLNHGQQRQRIGRGPEFTRRSNVAALYAPGVGYHEYQRQGERLDESYVLFTVRGGRRGEFGALVGPARWCHIADPDQLIGHRLRRLGELLFHRKPQFEWVAQGILLELLGLVLQSVPTGAQQRTLGLAPKSPGAALTEQVARYIRAHVHEPIRVRQLAAHVHLSESAFAHTYPKVAGEAPYRTILRLKMETAKRLLLQERLTVKETSGRLGFSSEFHFSRVFRQLEGLPPSAYRRSLTK